MNDTLTKREDDSEGSGAEARGWKPKSITCATCGKQEWRHPQTIYCCDCGYKRATGKKLREEQPALYAEIDRLKARLAASEADVRVLMDERDKLRTSLQAVMAERAELERDAALSAKMLARQTDMARQAEFERNQAIAEKCGTEARGPECYGQFDAGIKCQRCRPGWQRTGCQNYTKSHERCRQAAGG